MLPLYSTVTYKGRYFQLQFTSISSQNNTYSVYVVINFMVLILTCKLKLSTVDKIG